MIAKVPRQRATKARAGTQSSANRFFVAMHETNVALCMASGFLWVRGEPSAAVDHHAQHGGLVLSRGPVSELTVTSARGGLDYGSVALLELREGTVGSDQPMPKGGPLVFNRPIPLAEVRRAIFRNDDELRQFKALADSYADVPSQVIDVFVAPELFPPAVGTDTLFKEMGVTSGGSAALDLVPYDKLGGALAGALHAIRSLPGKGLVDLVVRALGSRDEGWTAASLVASLGDVLDEKGKTPADFALLAHHAAEVLRGMQISSGFDSIGFIESLESRVAGSRIPEGVTKFVRNAKDVLASRREVSDDAFEDGSGKIVPRALVLFLLNSDADRMAAIPKRIRRLGPAVYCIACAFLGCYAGLANLPVKWKAEKTEEFLALGLVVRSLIRDRSALLEIAQRWGPSGDGFREMRFGDRTLFSQKLGAPKALRIAIEAAARLRLKTTVDQGSGHLSFVQGGRSILVAPGKAPSFPAADAIKVSASIEIGSPKKNMTMEIWAWLGRGPSLGVIPEVILSGKEMRLDFSAFVPLAGITDEAVRNAVAAVVDFLQARPDGSPSQSSAKGGGTFDGT